MKPQYEYYIVNDPACTYIFRLNHKEKSCIGKVEGGNYWYYALYYEIPPDDWKLAKPEDLFTELL